jgi:hypothetical protein
VYCGALDRCYLLPSALVVGRTDILLLPSPPLNGQRSCINLGSQFKFPGAVAQLEERGAGSAEARGSSPLSSTGRIARSPTIATGANQFRNHFGYYLERAAAGDEILISRRGRPYLA